MKIKYDFQIVENDKTKNYYFLNVGIDTKEIEDDKYDTGYIKGYAKYFCENEIGNTIFI